MNGLALLFLTVSQTLSLPPGLLSAICMVESGHNVSAINVRDRGSPSIGLCELKLGTARQMGFKGDQELLQRSAAINILYAGRYLSRNLHRYPSDIACAIAAYNSGTCNHNDAGLIKNRKYVKKVLDTWRLRVDTEAKPVPKKNLPPR